MNDSGIRLSECATIGNGAGANGDLLAECEVCGEI